jgi:hypothetical protein
MSRSWKERVLSGSKYKVPKDFKGNRNHDVVRQGLLDSVALGMDFLEQHPELKLTGNQAEDTQKKLWDAIGAVDPRHSGNTMSFVIANIQRASEIGWKNYLESIEAPAASAAR